jgi:hypothetical protein
MRRRLRQYSRGEVGIPWIVFYVEYSHANTLNPLSEVVD